MLKLLLTRRSVREWNSTPVSDAEIHHLLEAAMNAPSAINEQAWQFMVLKGDVLEKVNEINSNTPKGAPVAILVCQDLKREKAAGYSVQDCAAAVENILLGAHALGLGAVWTAVYKTNLKALRQVLNFPEDVQPFALIPIGHPTGPAPHAENRFDASKVHIQGW
jgi:nitroreductase